MKNRWLLYVVLFMLVANAALVTTLLVQGKSDNLDVNLKSNAVKEKKHQSFDEHLRVELSLTDEQYHNIVELRKEFMHDKRNLYRQKKELRRSYFEGFSQNDPDSINLKELANNIAVLEIEGMKLEKQHYRNIRSVCSESQAAKLDSLGRRHMQRNFKDKGWNQKRRHNCSDRSNK